MKFEDYWAQIHEPDSKQWEDKPHGWIQWKGTDVCVDLYCECGAHGHIDGYFLYHYECLGCGRKYALSANVKLIEMTPEQAKFVNDGGGCAFQSDPDTKEEPEQSRTTG